MRIDAATVNTVTVWQSCLLVLDGLGPRTRCRRVGFLVGLMEPEATEIKYLREGGVHDAKVELPYREDLSSGSSCCFLLIVPSLIF